jgi:hypothetical protein
LSVQYCYLSFCLSQAIVTSQNFDGQDDSKNLSSRLLGIPRRKIGKGTRIALPLLTSAFCCKANGLW